MQSKYIKKIPTSIRIILQFIFIMILLIAKSSYLILFLTVLVLMQLILSNATVKVYIKSIKNSIIWLLFFTLMYIIIFRNIILTLIFTYKLVLIVIILKNFAIDNSFNNITNGLYTLLQPLKNTKINIEKISYKIAISYLFVLCYIESKKKIKLLKIHCVNKKIYYKNFVVSRILLASNEVNNIEIHLKLNYYKPKKEKISIKSYILLILFVILLIVTIFKEVVL